MPALPAIAQTYPEFLAVLEDLIGLDIFLHLLDLALVSVLLGLPEQGCTAAGRSLVRKP